MHCRETNIIFKSVGLPLFVMRYLAGTVEERDGKTVAMTTFTTPVEKQGGTSVFVNRLVKNITLTQIGLIYVMGTKRKPVIRSRFKGICKKM